MIASFKKHWADGTATYFVGKIWSSILNNNLERKKLNLHLYEQYYMTSYGMFLTKKIKEHPNELFGNFGFDIDYATDLPQKPHTIRAGNRWKAGDKIHFGINPRSKNYFQFAPVIPCVSVQTIKIRKTGIGAFITLPQVFVDGIQLNNRQIELLSVNDGFTSVEDFANFFVPNKDDIFTGQIVHWTDLRY